MAAIFLALLCLPLARLAWCGDESHAVLLEQRQPAARPSLARGELARFPGAFDAWYRDAFGFRTALLRAHARLHWDLLRHSPEPSMLRGADGWLFYDDVFAEPQIPRERPFGAVQLEAWRLGLEAWRDWLAEQGVEFVVAFAPDKGRIYPELAPRRAAQRRVDRLPALRAHLAAHSSIRLVDLEPALLAEKAHDLPGDWTYSPHGIHWSSRGAFAAYRALAWELASAGRVPALERGDLERVRRTDAGDSWAPRLYLDGVLEHGRWELVCRAPEPFARTVLDGDEDLGLRLEQPAPHLPRLLLLHDSFGSELRPFLAHEASRLDAVAARGLDVRAVARAAPDAVVLLCGERLLDFSVPGFVLGAAGEAQRASFEASSTVLYAWDDVRGGEPPRARGALRLERRADGMSLEASPGGALDLPQRAPAPGRGAMLRVALEVREPARLKVLAVPAQPVRAGPRELLDHRIEPGAPPFHLRVWDLASDEHLALHWVSGAAQARLRSLVLREVELPAQPQH